MANIIICNDEIYTLNLYKIYLEKAGHQVVIYDDVVTIKSGGYKVPDLFVLDRLMNDADGLEVCWFLKQQPSVKDIPVLMISTDADIHEKAKAVGAESALRKPFTREALVDAVATLL